MSAARPAEPADVRQLFTRFVLLVLLPVVGLVGFGVMAIANERAAVEKRFQEEFGGKLRILASRLLEWVDEDADAMKAGATRHSERISFHFRETGGSLETDGPTTPEKRASLHASLRAAYVPPGTVTLLAVSSGPARGLYALRRIETGLEGLAFDEAGLAAAVEEAGRRLFPEEGTRFTLVGPREVTEISANPVRRLLEEITQDRAENGPLAFPLPPPLADWKVVARLADDDPVTSALWRNRTIYIVVLSLFYVVIAFGVWLTLQGISREVRLSRLKTDFVSNISHELRTPLTSIRMFAETLKMGRATSPEEQAACIDFIFRESERLGHLAERTLDWARMEAGRRAYVLRRAAPALFVSRIVEGFLERGTLPRDRLTLELGSDLPEVDVDEAAIELVLLNLLENAVKYTPDEKRIRVAVRARGRRLCIDVQDNGIGIARRDHKRIFERFYRADDLLARGTEGTGLGLSIARRVAEAHGGRITVDSRLGAGSTFTVELPTARTDSKTNFTTAEKLA